MPSTEPIVFAIASLADENDVIQLHKSRLAETNRLTSEKEQSIETGGRQLFQKIVAHPDYGVAIGKNAAGKAICTASFYLLPMIRRGKHILFVEYVFVDAQYRGQKIGQQLMEFIDQLARDKGAQTIKLSVNKDTTTDTFYEKQGYRYTDRLMRKDA